MQPFHLQLHPPGPLIAYTPSLATIIEVGSSPQQVPSQRPLQPLKQPCQSTTQQTITLITITDTPLLTIAVLFPLTTAKDPKKWKSKGSAKTEQETEIYGLFIEVPKKPSAKKGKLSYDQYGPWEFQAPLLWTQFCNLIAEKMSCMPTTLDVDSFAWQPKPMGTSANIKNEFGYNQMVSCVHIMR